MALKQRKRGATPLPSKLVYGVGDGEDLLTKSEVHVVPQGTTRISELAKSITNTLDGSPGSVERLAFEVDPNSRNVQSGVYKDRIRLIPDALLKRIAIQDSLVSNIVRARQNHMSSFGRPRPDRFSTGYQIRARPEILDKLDVAGRKKLAEQISAAHKKFETCGSTQGLDDEDIVTFAQWITLTTRNAVVNGRIATEIVHTGEGDTRRFHHFAPTDAGTIYRAAVDSESAESVRTTAYEALCRLAGKKLVEEEFGRGKRKGAAFKSGYEKGDYVWIQVIEGRPVQAFTATEMRCYNFFPVPDVEMEGYPVTPIDTVISAVTTHINIVNHNRLYFQSGRASRGMLVIKSDDAGPGVISNIKQQFNASINSVGNAWRMPVFGCSTEEDIEWKAIDTGGGKDMEFQYLTDLNAREILTAFMMSPDELPGWSYLSRGTNSQALSEGNNEYKMQAARDVGIRPLIASFEDYINSELFPLIDPELAKQARLYLVGLEADNPEKESVRIQQDQALHMSFDDIREKVEKEPMGAEWGGDIPLNPAYLAILNAHWTAGEIEEHFFKRANASRDPTLAYRADPNWMQWQQMQMQQKMAQQQAQAAAAGGGQPGGGGGQPPAGGGGGPPQDGGGDSGGQNPAPQTENQKSDASAGASASGQGASEQLARSIDEAVDLLKKSEDQLPPDKRRLLAQSEKTVEFFLRGFLKDQKDVVDAIMKVAEPHTRGKG